VIDPATVSYQVICADCLGLDGLATLPDKSVDHVICDPPYEAEAHTKQRRVIWNGRSKQIRSAPLDFEPMTPEGRAEAARQMVRVARGWILAFCQAEGIDRWREALNAAGARWRRAALWVKPDGQPQLTGDRPAQCFEAIACAWAGDGRSRWNGGGRSGIYEHATNNFGRLYGPGERPHPTVKPLALMEALIRDFTDPGDLVVDPFAGSGTTGVAAKRLGRRFIGWERDPKYHAIAEKRIEGAKEQRQLFVERGPEPVQVPLIGSSR
jgi:DNA modification methylase